MALINDSDNYHQKAWELLADPRWDFRFPPVVFVEVFHIRIRNAVSQAGRIASTRAFASVLTWLVGDEVPFQQEEITPADYQRVGELLTQYAPMGIDYVDTVVVATAERLGTPYVMTVDQRHFRQIRPRRFEYFILPMFGDV
ncbi:MAG: PIN domain-containing protein [Anaerolineae bacterium]|nr:PIN domain-containing protein [Anaerolineae bacterium]